MVKASAFVCLLIVAAAAKADQVQPPNCSIATLNGTYGVQRNGHNNSGRYISSIGVAVFDGNGRISGHETVSQNGIFTKAELAESYDIHTDCTGTRQNAS